MVNGSVNQLFALGWHGGIVGRHSRHARKIFGSRFGAQLIEPRDSRPSFEMLTKSLAEQLRLELRRDSRDLDVLLVEKTKPANY